MKLKANMEEVILEITVKEDTPGYRVTPITITQPHLIKVEIGKMDIPIGRGMLNGILSSSKIDIKEILLPKHIPSELIEMLYPIFDMCSIPVVYLSDGQTGLSRGKYTMQMGHMPSELEEGAPVPMSNNAKNPLDYLANTTQTSDGYTPLPVGELDEITDGFHEIPTERREMWTEDPERMNRLSYVPIGKTLGVDTFPTELGGGTF